MKKVLFGLAFMVAVIGSFAFNTRPTSVTAHYLAGGSCTATAQTDQNNCIANGPNAQCTVNISGHPKAWNKDDCTEPLNLP